MGEGARIGQHRRVCGQVSQAHALAGAQGVVRRGHEAQRVIPQPGGLQRRRGVRGQRGDGQLGLAGQHVRIGLFGIDKGDVQFHLWELLTVAAQQRRQVVQADMVAGGDAQGAADAIVQCRNRAAGIGGRGQQRARAFQQQAAGLGGQHRSAEAVEQAHAQLGLQLGDAFAHCRLGQVQLLGGGGEAAVLDHRDEHGQAGQVH